MKLIPSKQDWNDRMNELNDLVDPFHKNAFIQLFDGSGIVSPNIYPIRMEERSIGIRASWDSDEIGLDLTLTTL